MRSNDTKKVLRLFILVTVTVTSLLFLLNHLAAVRESASALYRSGNWENVAAAAAATTTIDPITQRTRKLQRILKCRDRELTWEISKHGHYWTMRNVFRGYFSRNVSCAGAVTYTTIGDYTFIDNLGTLTKSWNAPISFAIHAPGHDFAATMDAIQFVRNCGEDSDLIRRLVSFHIFFPADHLPATVPHTPEEAENWPYDCYVPVPPFLQSEQLVLYKTTANLTYPINVARNIARQTANTHFILASDIELFPSPRLSDMFLDMVAANQSVIKVENRPRVFPLPVFEVESNASIPCTKAQLLEMLATKQAIPFHSRMCKICHLVPNQNEWYQLEDAGLLSVAAVGRREHNFKFWEPFYISDNREPLFDERVTWEGQSNKRIQGYAMCLLGYEYHVLHPAFLVHSPGIKRMEHQAKSGRFKYVAPMNKLIRETIEPEYRILYGFDPHCKT